MMRLLLSDFASGYKDGDEIKIMDVQSAFLYGKARRTIYIELPEQDEKFGRNFVGKLERALYGTRDASLIWQEELRTILEQMGFESSVLEPSIYFHSNGVKIMVHVDDFLGTGPGKYLNDLEEKLLKKYEIKVNTLSPKLAKSGEYLGRRIHWGEEGLEIEGDPKHVS